MEVVTEVVIVAAAGLLLLIGFICGYGVRALISRRRRAKAERQHFERVVRELAQRGKRERLAITFQRGDSRPVPPEVGTS